MCVCHSCTCDMRDTCTTATGISQESEDADSARRERAAQKVSRGENARHSTPQIPTGEKSATFATLGEIGDFLGGAKIGDFCHFGKSATFVPGGKRGPAAILINAYSGDFCHPVLSNAVAPEPLVYHSGTKCAILGHFRAPPPFWPFWAILGHFVHFWPFLALFGPPRPPPAPIFGPEFPRTSPKTSPRTSAMRKKPRAHPRRKKISRRTLRANVRRTFSRRTLRAKLPRANLHKILPAHFCAQNPDTNSAQIPPRTFVHKFPGRKFCAEFSGRKIVMQKFL